MKPEFHAVTTALLDLDGVLIDLHFANHFWQEYLPCCYGEQHQLPVAEAKRKLNDDYRAVRSTLKWYCTDYWSERLQLDIQALKRSQAQRINLRPGAQALLERLGTLGIRRVLVSNAHPESVALKLATAGIRPLLDEVCSSHELGLAKETPGFWQRFEAHHRVELEHSLFIDDNEEVLQNAHLSPIGQLYTVLNPDSMRTPRTDSAFADAGNFADFFPVSASIPSTGDTNDEHQAPPFGL